MKKLAAIFAAAVMVFTIGACVQGKASDPQSNGSAAVVREF